MPSALVVDDSAAVRRLVTDLLTEHHWTTEACASAEEGAARALSSPFDAVVVDLWMPGTSGLQMCRLLRHDPFTADLPVVLLTASSDRRTRFWAKLSGATAFLEKRCMRDLPQVLAGIHKHRAVNRAPARPVDASKIPARLSNLLDENLFDIELASRVRGLALDQGDVEGLFRGLADLLSSIVSYRYLALSVEQGAETSVFVHASPIDRTGPDDAVFAVTRSHRAKPLVVADDRCVVGRQSPPAPLERVIQHGGAVVGRLAVALADADPNARDAAAVDLVAREIAMPLRLSALVEATQRCAMTDDLTGLPNRRGGASALDRAVAAAERHDQALSVVLIDIDRFKLVNDTHGHHGGDLTLKHVASVLNRCARRSDLVARWGGEEFLAILPSTDTAGARTVAERLRTAVSMAKVALDSGAPIDVTISAGVASLGGESALALVNRADRALYVAKNNGRNRVELSDQAAPRFSRALRGSAGQ